MPEADIAHEPEPVTIEHLEQLKLKWGVAIAALLKRAETLGLITRAGATQPLDRAWAASGYRRSRTARGIHPGGTAMPGAGID